MFYMANRILFFRLLLFYWISKFLKISFANMTSVRVLRCITYSKYFNPFVRCAVSSIKPVQLGNLSLAPMPRPLLSCGAPIQVPCRGYAKGRDKAKGEVF